MPTCDAVERQHMPETFPGQHQGIVEKVVLCRR